MTNAFYFGPADKPLFGIYHEPSLGRERQTGVVLCYPHGQEYIRSHRSYQKLAVRLSKSGFHVFRFDYFASGDSAGDSDSGTLRQWLDDIQEAIREIKDCAGIEEVSLIGLRFGATLAALSTIREPRTNVKNLVLWEPVVNGKDYLAELLRDHDAWMSDLSPKPAQKVVNGAGTEILGFPLADQARSEIEGIDLLTLKDSSVSRAFVLGATDEPGFSQLSVHLQSQDVECEYQCVGAPRVWLKRAGVDLALVPNDSLRSIAAWIERASP